MLNKLNSIVSNLSSVFKPTPISCILCGSKIHSFQPLSPLYAKMMQSHGFPHNLNTAETLNTEAYTCPKCGGADRDRLYALFFDKNLDSGKNYKVLDIAPAKSLSKFLKKRKNITYRSADLYMPGVDDKVDITDMAVYSDNTFDIFVCSHVLEHVPDDKKAMRELYRVLKPGGWGIAMVPIMEGVKDIEEDPTVADVGERWKRFGQDDHIRLYSKQGFKTRLFDAGFEVIEYKLGYFSEEEFVQNGISLKSVLYVVYK